MIAERQTQSIITQLIDAQQQQLMAQAQALQEMIKLLDLHRQRYITAVIKKPVERRFKVV